MIKQYLAVLRGTYMVGMIYRFGFLFAIVGNVVYMAITYFLWKSIYHNREVLHGLTFDETFLYVALASAVFILLKTYADWIIAYEIREGIIATYLIKPMDFQLYAMFATFGSALMNLTVITIPTILLLTLVFHVQITFGPGLLLFPVSLLLAFVISFCIDYFVGLLGFYSESVWGLSTVKEIILSVFSGALIPLQFFPDAMEKVLLWLPFQAIFHTPLMMVTKPNMGMAVFIPMLLVQLMWAVALLMLTRLFYNQAIKVLRISGG